MACFNDKYDFFDITAVIHFGRMPLKDLITYLRLCT